AVSSFFECLAGQDLVVEFLVRQISSLDVLVRHGTIFNVVYRRIRRQQSARLDGCAAMTTVSQHENADASSEVRQRSEHLIIDKLAIIEAPGLIEAIILVGIEIRQLTAVSGI